MTESRIDWEGEDMQRELNPDPPAIDEERNERPTIEYAARVLFEAMCHCDVPAHVTQAMTTWASGKERPPVWSELSDIQRSFWERVLHACVVTADRFEDAPELAARILVLYPDEPIRGQDELFPTDDLQRAVGV